MYLSPKVAQRVFSEQLRDVAKALTGGSGSSISEKSISLYTLLFCHKKQFGYQILPQSLGLGTLWMAVKQLPFIEVSLESDSLDSLENSFFQQIKKCFRTASSDRQQR